MNIPRALVAYAEKLNASGKWQIEELATGGGMDFLAVQTGRISVVLSGIDGESPRTLKSKAWVSIKLDEDWTESVDVPFKTTKDALDAMSRLFFNVEGGTQ